MAQRWLYVSRPSATVSSANYSLESIPIPIPQEDEILVKALFISVDPYMRIQQSAFNTWEEPHPLNTVQGGGIVGEVIESKDTLGKIKTGDIVTAYLGWQTHAVCKASDARKIDTQIAPISYHLGVLGMPGRTAYFGLLDAGKPKAGETVVVSGAAGAVGHLVVQIAKIVGCRVVGIAGSQQKLDDLKKLGADAVINYRIADTFDKMNAALKEACPSGIDVYFDNTGGFTTDAVIHRTNLHARIVICGQISQYNGGLDNPELGPRFLHHVLYKRLTIQGILARDYYHRMNEMLSAMGPWIKEGKIVYHETVWEGFEKLPDALAALFTGTNNGKMIVRIN